MKKIILLVLFVVALLAMSKTIASNPEWHMVNVNHNRQGDAHLIIDSGTVWLIDSGDAYQASKYLAPYIKSLGITTINDFVGSHPHRDHVAGINSLLDAGIKINNVHYNMPDDMLDDWDFKRAEFNSTLSKVRDLGGKTNNVKAGFILKGPKTKLTVLHAQKHRKVGGRSIDTNDYSIIAHLDINNHRALLTGDLNKTLGAELAKMPHIKADILKCPHHCVEGIAGNDFFDAVSPKMVMIPSTRTLWHHHRGFQAKNWITRNVSYYCNNGLNGNVVLTFGEKISIKSQKPSNACPDGILNISPRQKINPPLRDKLAGVRMLILDL